MAPLPSFPDQIDILTEQFSLTGNRALAWHIYHICRTTARPIPDEIQAVVDRFAAGVSVVAQAALDAEPDGETIRFEPADVGRLWRDQDEKDPVGLLQAETIDAKIAVDILRRNNLGDPVTAAIEHWAAKKIHRLGKDRLWKIWGAFQKPTTPGPRTVR